MDKKKPNKNPTKPKQPTDVEIHKRLFKNDDFRNLAAAAKVFRKSIDEFEFKPNLFWGEDKTVVKTKPDLLTELLTIMTFIHGLENNLVNLENNLGASLILAGHINIFDAYNVMKDPDSAYNEALWELYTEAINASDIIKTRAANGTQLDETELNAACIHFYEYFLESYDKQLRTDMGVWYTPESVVGFINSFIKLMMAKHFPGQRETTMDFATGTGTFMLDYIKREYELKKDTLERDTLKYHLFNICTGCELNDMAFILAVYNVNKLIYTLLGEWTGEIPLLDPDRPLIMPLYNGNTLETSGISPYLGTTKISLRKGQREE